MDTRPYSDTGAGMKVNYSVLRDHGDGPKSQGPGSIDLDPQVFPYDVTRHLVPGFVNGSGFWNDSVLYINDVLTSNGTNSTNVTCAANETCPDQGDPVQLPLWQVGFFGFLAVTTIVVTIVGNLIVILSFFLERTIRQPTNYFIASLAMSDLLIGSLSMPFYTLYLLSGQRWTLGIYMCDLWLSVDYTVCLTSIYTVFAITIDRFCSVKIPAKYRNWRTERKVLVIVALTWIIPAVLFFVSIFAWSYIYGERTVPSDMCYVQYLTETIFNVTLQVSYFWITLIVMCVLYTGIYKVALDLQSRANAKRNKMTSLVSMAGQTMTRIGIGMSQQAAVDARKLFDRTEDSTEGATQVTQITNSKSAENRANNNQASGTSFTSSKSPGNPEDRSSSPTFPSDTDPSSQSPKGSPQPTNKATKASNKSRSRSKQSSDKNSSTFKLQKPPKGRRSKLDGNTPSANCNDTVHVITEVKTRAENHVSLDIPEMEHAEEQGFGELDPLTPSTEQRPLPTADSCCDNPIAELVDVEPPKVQEPNDGVNMAPEVLAGVKYIDQNSLKSLHSSDNLRTLTEAAKALTSCDEISKQIDDEQPDSPVWKMRDSVVRSRNSKNSSPVSTKDKSASKADTPKRAVSEPITPGVSSMLDSAEPSVVFSPSPNNHTPAALQVEARGAEGRPVTHIHPRSGSKKEHDKSSKRSRSRPGGGSSSPLTALAKSVKHSKRSKTAKNKEKQRKQSSRENRARKALRTITIILGAFVLCWTPWHVLSLIIGFTPQEKQGFVLLKLYDISYWLCYLNSPINPFCYAMANAQFKKAFIRIIKLDWHRS